MSIKIGNNTIAISGKQYYTKTEVDNIIDTKFNEVNTVLESLIGTGMIDLSLIDTINGEVV